MPSEAKKKQQQKKKEAAKARQQGSTANKPTTAAKSVKLIDNKKTNIGSGENSQNGVNGNENRILAEGISIFSIYILFYRKMFH